MTPSPSGVDPLLRGGPGRRPWRRTDGRVDRDELGRKRLALERAREAPVVSRGDLERARGLRRTRLAVGVRQRLRKNQMGANSTPLSGRPSTSTSRPRSSGPGERQRSRWRPCKGGATGHQSTRPAADARHGCCLSRRRRSPLSPASLVVVRTTGGTEYESLAACSSTGRKARSPERAKSTSRGVDPADERHVRAYVCLRVADRPGAQAVRSARRFDRARMYGGTEPGVPTTSS